MLRNTGIDLGTTGKREVSVGLLPGMGAPREGNGGSSRTASVPSSILTFRRIVLPPANREVCRRVVQEELAYSLPFPVEDAAFDWTGERGGEAWVVVAPNLRLEPVRREVGEEAALDAEPLGYQRACGAAHIHSALVIDFGASRTTYCGIVAGRIDWVRVMLRGGIWMTNKLADKLKLSREQAEALKCTKGTAQMEVRELVRESLGEAGVPTPLPYDHVLVCGGGAGMPGLAPVIKEMLGVEPELFPLPDGLSPYEHVPAFGAALARRFRQPRIELVDQKVTEAQEASGWRTLALWVGLLLLLVTADLEQRHYSLAQRLQNVQANLQQAVEPALGKTDLPPDQILDRLKKQIARDKEIKASSVKYVMDLIGRLSVPLKASKDAKLTSVSVDNGSVILTGEVGSLKQAQELLDALKKIFPDLKQNHIRTGTLGHVIYEFSGKIPTP